MSSLWIKTTDNMGAFEKLEKELETEVCIIGGGMVGLTTAYYLCKNGYNVTILEKDKIGEKTSGNTTAKITSQHGIFYNYLLNDFGKDFAKKYLKSNEKAIENIKQIIDEENIDCDFEYQSNYVYALKTDELSQIKEEVGAVNLLGGDAKFIDKTELPFDTLCAIEFKNQAQFHPRKYMLGLCDSITQNGGKIYTNTKVYDVEKKDGMYAVKTMENTIKCKYVVLASHYPFINMPGFYFAKMYQETSYAIAVDTKTELFNGMYINVKQPIYSFRTAEYNGKKILILAGSNHKTGEAIENNKNYEDLENKAKELYPDSEILFRWNTRDCISLDKVPYIGEFSKFMPNVYVATGFKKWGMTTSNVAANIITDKIMGKENKYEEIYNSTRIDLIKNRWEVKNMIKQTATSEVIEKFKIKEEPIENIQNDNGAILKIDGKNVGIYKDTSGNIFAVKPYCTHLGCMLAWNNLDKTWDCPCHGSRFDYMGKNIYDPAMKDLEIYNIDM